MPFLELTDFTMHYAIHGQGNRKVMLIHGNIASTRWWQFLWPYVSSDYQVLVMDLRGCGQSGRPIQGYTIQQFTADVYQLVHILKWDEFHLLGHSMGGQISMDFTLAHPEMVKTLTLMDSVPATGLALDDEARKLFHIIRKDKNVLQQAILGCAPYCQDQEYLNDLTQDAFSCASNIYTDNPETMNQTVLLEKLSEMKAPTLIIHGREDIIIPVDSMKVTMDVMPQARVILLEKCGHSPFIEVPKLAANYFFEFIEQQEEKIRRTKQ